MSYQAQAALEADYLFQQRTRAAAIQQSAVFRDNPAGDLAALADAVARDEPGPTSALIRLDAAGPGIADKVETPSGIDSSLVTDADLLALTQGNWPTVAALYFAADGTPLDAL